MNFLLASARKTNVFHLIFSLFLLKKKILKDTLQPERLDSVSLKLEKYFDELFKKILQKIQEDFIQRVKF